MMDSNDYNSLLEKEMVYRQRYFNLPFPKFNKEFPFTNIKSGSLYYSPFSPSESPVLKHQKLFDSDLVNAKEEELNYHKFCTAQEYKESSAFNNDCSDNSSATNQNLGTKLHCLSLVGYKEAINNIVTDEHFLETRDKWGRTALFSAVMGNNEHILSSLLKAGAKPDALDYYKKTCLHYAALLGHVGCMKLLVQALKEKDLLLLEDENKVTPLHYSAVLEHSKCLQLLLKTTNISMIDITDKKKRTPLHWAAASGSEENVKVLLKEGANPLFVDSKGKIPLHLAVLSNSSNGPACIHAIVTAAPSSINWQDFKGISALHLAIMTESQRALDVLLEVKSVNVDLADHQYRTALHWACNKGLLSFVNKLVDFGANISAGDCVGATPVHYAALHNHSDTVELLVRRPNVGDDKTKDGLTPLLWASMEGCNEAVTVMVRHGASLLQCDAQGWSALHLAAKRGHVKTIAILIKLNADINAINDLEQTALIVAAQGGHKEIVTMLVRSGASLNHQDCNKQTALHHAVMNGQRILTEIFINAGMSTDMKDIYGHTPLLMATCYGYLEIMSLLLESGVDVNARDNEGLCALHYAVKGKIAAVNILLSYKAHPNFISFTEDRSTPLNYAYELNQIEYAREIIKAGGLTTETIQRIAATLIQSVFRAYMERKRTNQMVIKKRGSKGYYRRLRSNKHNRNHLNRKKFVKSNSFPEKIEPRPDELSPGSDQVNDSEIETIELLSDSTINDEEVQIKNLPSTRNSSSISSCQRRTHKQLSLPLPEQLGIESDATDDYDEDNEKSEDSDEDYDVLNKAIKGPSFRMTNALKQPGLIAKAVVTTGETKPLKTTCDSKEEVSFNTNDTHSEETAISGVGEDLGTSSDHSKNENPCENNDNSLKRLDSGNRKDSVQSRKESSEWERRLSSLELYVVSPKRKDANVFSYNLTKNTNKNTGTLPNSVE